MIPPALGWAPASLLTQAHPGLSGIYPLVDGWDAFAARVLLAHRAERSLDLQYHIWRNDFTGVLLLEVRGDESARARVDLKLRALLGEPQRPLDLVSPYFVPGKEATAALSAISAQGSGS